jgi:hypothetical protein
LPEGIFVACVQAGDVGWKGGVGEALEALDIHGFGERAECLNISVP